MWEDKCLEPEGQKLSELYPVNKTAGGVLFWASCMKGQTADSGQNSHEKTASEGLVEGQWLWQL